MAIDREAALKRAEKYLRQGKVEGAIDEYARLIAEQSRDWATINALGDLYVRIGDTTRASEQFTRVADFLFEEGFFAKAQAVYKKALKVLNTDEHTLLRLSEIAATQEVFVDARLYLRQLAELRRERGDVNGLAECVIRLGSLPDADLPAKLGAVEGAEQLGQPERVALLLGESAVVFALARQELQAGKRDDGLQRLMRLVMDTPERAEEVLTFVSTLLDAGAVEDAFACLEVVVDAALLQGDLRRGIDLLAGFVARAPLPPAVARLTAVRAETDRDDSDADALITSPIAAADLVVPGDEPPVPLDEERILAELLASLTPDVSLPSDTDLQPSAAAVEPDVIVLESLEVDLSETLRELQAAPVLPPRVSVPTPAPDLESVFEAMRTRAFTDQQLPSDAEALYQSGLEHLRDGRHTEAVSALRAAARVPAWRFKAGAQLGRALIAAGDVTNGIEWLERAAEAPPPSGEEATSLLYDLAATLESAGETARALAVLLELNASAPGHRDVAVRIERLSRAQEGSGRT